MFLTDKHRKAIIKTKYIACKHIQRGFKKTGIYLEIINGNEPVKIKQEQSCYFIIYKDDFFLQNITTYVMFRNVIMELSPF